MLYSQTIGTGDNLVLLHGWGFNADLFDPLISQYQSQYRITKIDLPGHGRSNNVEGGLDEWCDEIIKILPKNPILLGWSLGGLLAINIATKIKISKLILVASTPNFVQNSNWEFGIDADNFRQFSDALTLNLSKGLKRFTSLQTKDKTQLKALNQSIDKYPATTTSLNQGLEILMNTDLTHELKSLSTPIKVILGNRDTLVPGKIKYWYQQLNIPTLILDTAHLPFLHDGFSL
ncbi:MAG: alpha/beta fold hydrolase [Candidatus Ruthia sp.]|jgi:pimeloyl-[acyl-carrier protein] methyl ester esterase|nr:alpha/beta fold hydrolase [Candidatus Ruthturnera sp.]MBT4668657.1 alpha/beta fold hydrolase [Candidatus Ruthturnera sp.]MBT6921875.1 alpha/beta fold hydrolase [Candidatus Ruthturnera sp.]